MINLTGNKPVEIRASKDLLILVYDGLNGDFETLGIVDELEGQAACVHRDEIDGLIAALLKAKSLAEHGHIGTMRQWKSWECKVMSWLDFRYWFCECHYWPPFGRVISGDCRKHD